MAAFETPLAAPADNTGLVWEPFGSGARVSYSLRPPLLGALVLERKITFGPWFKAVFRLLRMMRRLRGTPWDPFGYTRVRREERRLIGEYREMGESVAGLLQPDNCDLVARIADLPDMIRRYEGVKLRNVERYRQGAAVLLDELEGTGETRRAFAG